MISKPPKKPLKKKKDYKLLFLSLPFMIFVFLFSYVPLMGWGLAFFDYKAGIPLFKNEFLGLANFRYFFNDADEILRILKNTFIFAGLGLIIAPLPMIFAVFLNEIKEAKTKKVIQTLTTFPHFISWIIIYSLALALFSREGVLNLILMKLHLRSDYINLLGNGETIYYFLTAIDIWKETGWSAIIYLAAIAGISQEMYEAAYIDGANRFHQAIYITIPNLMNTFVVLFVLHIGHLINLGFEKFFVFKNPATMQNIEVMDLYVYRLGIVNHDYSYSIAIGIMKSFVSILLVFLANHMAKKIRGTGII